MKLMILVLFFALPSMSSWAANCAPKDLTDPSYLRSVGKENLINHFSEPRDQDSVGWCGAYASADSLSFAVGEPASALDISINQYARNKSKNVNLNNLNGITPNAASNVAQSVGYCPESVIPSNATGSSNLGGKLLTEIMDAFQTISNDFKARGKPSDYCVRCSVSDSASIIKQALPHVSDAMIKDVLVKFQGDSLASTRELMFKLCQGHRRKVSPTVVTYTRSQLRGRNSSDILSNALLNDSMPSIGISAGVFSSMAQDHEMIVVGQKPGRNGKCQYIIRNSWGRGCSYYNEPYASSCDASKGTFLMDEDTLRANLQDILIIKNTNSKPTKINPEKEQAVKEEKSDTEITPAKPNRVENSRGNSRQGESENKPSPSRVKNTQSNSNSNINSSSRSNSNTNSRPKKTIENNSDNASQDNNSGDNGSNTSSDSGISSLFSGLGNFISGIWNFFASLFKY
jgi:hypothetical protein